MYLCMFVSKNNRAIMSANLMFTAVENSIYLRQNCLRLSCGTAASTVWHVGGVPKV